MNWLLILKAIVSAIVETLADRLDQPSKAEDVKPTAESLSLRDRLLLNIRDARKGKEPPNEMGDDPPTKAPL